MTWFKGLRLIAALVFLIPFAVSAETVQLFLPTDRHNPAIGRHDALRIEMQGVDLKDLPALLDRYQPVLPKFDKSNPPVVPIYLSKRTPELVRQQIIQQAKEQLGVRFPDLKIRYSVRYLEDTGADPVTVQQTIMGSIDEAAKTLPQDAATAKAAEILKAATLKLGENAVSTENDLSQLSDPAVVRNVVGKVSIAKAMVTFMGRSAQLMQQGVDPTLAPILSSVALVGGDTALSYLATKYEVVIGKFMSDHPLPIGEREGVLRRIQELYTKSQVAQMIKGTLGNIGLWGLAVPITMQSLGHFANPTKVALPTGEDISTMFVTSTVSSGLYMAGFQGLEKLRQKGWIHQPAIDLILRANGFLWQLSSLALSSGNPQLKAVVPFILGPMWTVYGTPAVLAPLLPIRNERIVIVDPNLRNRADINQLEALEATHLVDATSSQSLLDGVKAAQAAKEIKTGTISRIAGRVVRGAGDLAANCGEAFSRILAKRSVAVR